LFEVSTEQAPQTVGKFDREKRAAPQDIEAIKTMPGIKKEQDEIKPTPSIRVSNEEEAPKEAKGFFSKFFKKS
jgi:hypothetical protein